MQRYNPKEIEPKWQQIWDETGVYTTDLQTKKPKYLAMSMFNYPSGAGIHIGHAMNYTISDVKARFKRQQGYESYHPVGWDAFGLPAENFAIKSGVSPQQSMAQIIPGYHKQYKAMGWSNDWEKEIATHLPEYYKWTQWIFSEMYRHGLAYQDSRMQWWCEKDATVLANEQVIDGKCWRHDGPDDPLVEKKEIKQWFFKITDYADELLEATESLDWTESVKLAQKNWIGKSKGAEIEFVVGDTSAECKDTLKFTPRLTDMIQAGQKWSTVRLEPKNVQVGDLVKLQTRFDANDVRSFAVAKIKSVQTSKLGDIANDHAGHEAYDSDAEKLADYKGYYGDQVTLDTEFTVYEFEKTNEILTVFTTRPDTLFGATFMVIAPEHPIVDKITTPDHADAVKTYKLAAAKKTEVERQESKEKTGEFTGAYAINPVNGEKLPIWTADYVLAGYGTGAIMAVPAHDERDNGFAEKYQLPIRPVVAPFADGAAGYRQADKDRPSVNMVGYDPKTDRYCALDWRENPYFPAGVSWPGGGMDAGETLEQAALREFTEETGYTDVTVDRVLPAAVAAYYDTDADRGKVSMRSVRNIVLVTVNDTGKTAQIGSDDYEKDAYEVVWITKEEALGRMNGQWAKIAEIAFDKGFHVGEGTLINSGKYDNVLTQEARETIVADLAAKGLATEKVNYRMRDWSVSRQRYWGAPIPIIHCAKCGNVLVPDEQLPVVLPELDDFAPSGDGRSALARAKDWLTVDCPQCGGPAERETDTLDTYICSSWYFYRYMDPHNQQQAFDPAMVKKWEPVDFYNGGDHATAHLLYARFIGHFFKKLGLVDVAEPFKQFVFNGKITASDGTMFSKSKGTGVDPLEIINQGYGADALRTFLMFAAPLEVWAKWDPQGVPGTHRFLSRIWTLVGEYNEAKPVELTEAQQKAIRRSVHTMIRKVTEDIEGNRYNTAIAAAMTCVNDLYKLKTEAFGQHDVWHEALAALAACVSPFAPHIGEELWHQLGHSTSVHRDSWPKFDEQYLATDTVTVAVQINGKLRGTVDAPAGADEAAATELAKTDAKIAANLDGKQIIKVIYVPGKLLNFVIK